MATPRAVKPVGYVTRGTTGINRLRRIDRWMLGPGFAAWGRAERPFVVDLGFGAHGGTSLEMFTRLSRVRPDVEVLGLEIEPSRVARARAVERPGLRFALGGFEVPAARRPHVIRALNVLRQYERAEVEAAWAQMCARLAPGGYLIDGTCDEIGRRAVWLEVRDGAPVTLTISYRFSACERPSDVADRLPKYLIHENQPGFPIHEYLSALDAAWAHSAPLASFGARQRFLAMCREVRTQGWPVLQGPARWRLGEISIAWPV
ncbi:class I SAM-dependent methyltransferase [Micrococcales bacterium 31B]|nr:class I SAM-dependent methyltransferase [Micrococcales bacterium 31B]